MKLRHRSRQRGLALVSAIIVLVCILIIGAVIVKVLMRFCEKITPASPGGGVSTNDITLVESGKLPVATVVKDYQAALSFPPLPAVAGQTLERPFGNAWLEIERSTNLVDWVTIATIIDPPGDVDIMALDTNRPPDRAFYRGKFVMP